MNKLWIETLITYKPRHTNHKIDRDTTLHSPMTSLEIIIDYY